MKYIGNQTIKQHEGLRGLYRAGIIGYSEYYKAIITRLERK